MKAMQKSFNYVEHACLAVTCRIIFSIMFLSCAETYYKHTLLLITFFLLHDAQVQKRLLFKQHFSKDHSRLG